MTRPEVAALHRALEDQGYYVTPIGDAVKVHERGEEGPILHLAPLVEAVLAAQWRPRPVTDTEPAVGVEVFGWYREKWLPMWRDADGGLNPGDTDVDVWPQPGDVKWWRPMLPPPPKEAPDKT